MAIATYYLENVGRTFIFECNCVVDLFDINRLPEFYVDTLKAWSETIGECIPQNYLLIRDKILWNTKNTTIAEKSIYYRDWQAVGIKN